MLAKDIMTKDVITVTREDTIENVIKILMEREISGIPVVNDKGEIEGIITEGDLIYRSKNLKIPTFLSLLGGYVFLESTKKLEQQIKKMSGYKVEDVMTKEVVTVDEDETIENIATTMTKKKINRIPVEKEGKLVGIISRKDIIKSYT